MREWLLRYLPVWLVIQWYPHEICPFMYIGLLLIVWDRPKNMWHKDKTWYWPRNVGFSWNPM